jgi:transcriptional regulator NrdR family protein
MTYIIKRISGDREEFEAEKIRKALKKTYLDAELAIEDFEGEIEEIVLEVVKHFKNGDAVPSSHIRDLVVARLEEVRPPAAEEWKRFERKYKRKISA